MKTILSVLLALAGGFPCLPSAWGHGGTTRLTGAPVGPYFVTVYAQSESPRVGRVHMSALVMRPLGFPILDAKVQVTASLPDRSRNPISSTALRGDESYMILYDTELLIPQAGTWMIFVQVEGAHGSGGTSFEFVVGPPAPWNWPLVVVSVWFIFFVGAIWREMGRSARGKRDRGEAQLVEGLNREPLRLLSLLALLGIGLTAYLTASAWSGQPAAGCPGGAGCEVFLTSRWAKLLGLPTSFWGLLTYMSLAGIAFIKRAFLRWQLAWSLALFGVLFSAYLTAVSLVELKAVCLYCLLSTGLMAIIFATVFYARLKENFSWSPWLLKTVPGALLVVVALHLQYAGLRVEDPSVRALAEHLAKTGAKFYCAHGSYSCEKQTKMFGTSARRLPYIECSPQGPSAPQERICQEERIQAYPTWIIGGRRYEWGLSLTTLADHSGFKGGF